MRLLFSGNLRASPAFWVSFQHVDRSGETSASPSHQVGHGLLGRRSVWKKVTHRIIEKTCIRRDSWFWCCREDRVGKFSFKIRF